jgi:long-chain acyl-CoA synthetase
MLNEKSIHTLLCSLIASELSAKNPSLFGQLSSQDLKPETRLREGDLALDSLSLTRLAIAAASFFDLYRVNLQERLLAGKSIGQWTHEISKAITAGADGLHFMSSGTSGIPKSMHHPSAYLMQEAQAWVGQLLPLGLKRAVLACPAHHIYGCIWGVLVPQTLGIDTIVATPGDLPKCLQPRDLLITVPPVWDYLAPAEAHIPANILGICSTGPLLHDTRDALAHGTYPVWEIYGSSETAGIASRAVTTTDYSLLDHWFKGDAPHTLLRHCPDGAMRAYELPDEIEWPTERRLRPIKRRDQVIQVGGNNVSPNWVADEIRALPNIKNCAVRAHGQGANSFLKGFIVLTEDTETHRHDVAFLIRTHLPHTAMPKHLSFGAALPTNAMGKLADWPISS